MANSITTAVLKIVRSRIADDLMYEALEYKVVHDGLPATLSYLDDWMPQNREWPWNDDNIRKEHYHILMTALRTCTPDNVYNRIMNVSISTIDQSREVLFDKLVMMSTLPGFGPQNNAFFQIAKWLSENEPPDDASWQEKVRHSLAMITNVEFIIKLQERYGIESESEQRK